MSVEVDRMTSQKCALVALVVAMCLYGSLYFGLKAAIAQSSTPSYSTAFIDSARAKRKAIEETEAQRQKRVDERHEKELQVAIARNKKRADCRSQAKAQKLNVVNRLRFVKRCMAQ